MSPSARVKHENIYNGGHLISGFSSVKAVRLLLLFWITICCVSSCRTATLDFFFDLAESKVAVFLCSILTSDGVPFCFGKNSFP